MRLDDEDRELLCEATRFAWRWHGHQTRKGKTAPYVGHLLQVHGLVIEHGGNTAQSIAALLHDALEDADSAAQRAERESILRERFDPDVYRIVLDCTDTADHEAGESRAPWHDRKERYVAQLAHAAPDSLLVAACDKRHNLGDLVGDLQVDGLATLDRFNAGPRDQLWYFETLEALFRPHVPDRLARDLSVLVEEFRRAIGRSAS
jgi:(p)ppGpp synthase/HD superfamily hydrolase